MFSGLRKYFAFPFFGNELQTGEAVDNFVDRTRELPHRLRSAATRMNHCHDEYTINLNKYRQIRIVCSALLRIRGISPQDVIAC